MKIIKNLSWIFASNIFVAFSKWLMVIIIARELDVSNVGAYTLAFAITAPITLFANMKLRSLYITGVSESFEEFLYVRNVFTILAIVTFTILSFLLYPEYAWIIILVGLTKAIDLQSDLYFAIPHKKEKMDIIGKLLIGKNLLLLISFFSSVIIFSDLIIALIIQVILQFIYFSLIEKKYIESISQVKSIPTINNSKMNLVKIAIPLGLVQMIFSINSNLPRYFLEYFEDTEILGYFGALIYLATIFNLMMNAISQIYLPQLSRLFKNGEIKRLKRVLYINLTSVTLASGLVLLAVIFYWGEIILNILYGSEYTDYADILFIISISVVINMLSWNLDTTLMAINYLSVQLPITVINLLITTLIGWSLIESFGLLGASYTLVVSAIFMLVMRLFFVYKRLQNLH